MENNFVRKLQRGLGVSVLSLAGLVNCGDTYNTTNENHHPNEENGGSAQKSHLGQWLCAFDVETGGDNYTVAFCDDGKSYLSFEGCSLNGSWQGESGGTVKWDDFQCDWSYSTELTLDCGKGTIFCDYVGPGCPDNKKECQ